ncbi:MAG: DeoR/GlpR family DNA-binding transcription regulator [Acidobacteriota bacterium]
MLSGQRQQKILELLQAQQFVRVSELVRALGASQASIRRDLQALERAGLLKRTHGGAARRQTAGFELSLAEKEDRFKAEKAAIAEVALSLVSDGDTVMLDAGSTTLQIARRLKERRNIKVVTNAVNIAWELSSSELEVTLIGGTLRRNTLALVGPIAITTVAGLHVDKLFLATNGLDLKRGLTSPSLIEAQVKRAMLDSASEVIVVTDHSKFGRIAFSQVCSLDRVHRLITDVGAPRDFVQALERLRIDVLLAGETRG